MKHGSIIVIIPKKSRSFSKASLTSTGFYQIIKNKPLKPSADHSRDWKVRLSKTVVVGGIYLTGPEISGTK